MSEITYTRITPNGEERCEMLTTEEKLEKIKHLCMSVPDCGLCLLSVGKTCPTTLWKDWTDEQIDTAYDILTAKTAKDSLPNGDGMTRAEKIDAFEDYCRNVDGCAACALDALGYCKIDNLKWTDAMVDEVYNRITAPNFVKANPDDEIEPERDAVNHPNHYTQNGIECIEAIRASMTADGFCDYCKGNVLKYIWRWRDKGGVEDLRKAKVYLDWLIEEAEK